MLSNLSSNVVLAKARAMYGRRLTPQSYQELLACRSVSEIAAYLKSRTSYGKILSGINENDIHRGRLESLLRQRVFEDCASLCRYEISVGEHFSQYLLERAEIEQIIHSVSHLMAGSPEEYLFNMPEYLNRHTRIDLMALGRIKSFDDLLQAVARTPYHSLLQRFRPAAGQPLDYFGIEKALYQYLYSQVFSIIQKSTHGETQRELYELFNAYIDIQNYTYIVRLKFNYHSGPDFIRSSLLPFGTLRERHIDALLEAETPQKAREALEKTSLGKRIRNVDASEFLMTRVEYLICRHKIRFSTHPVVVMLSYVFLMEIELHDITNIIEGIRYQVPSDEIASLLTVLNSI